MRVHSDGTGNVMGLEARAPLVSPQNEEINLAWMNHECDVDATAIWILWHLRRFIRCDVGLVLSNWIVVPFLADQTQNDITIITY